MSKLVLGLLLVVSIHPDALCQSLEQNQAVANVQSPYYAPASAPPTYGQPPAYYQSPPYTQYPAYYRPAPSNTNQFGGYQSSPGTQIPSSWAPATAPYSPSYALPPMPVQMQRQPQPSWAALPAGQNNWQAPAQESKIRNIESTRQSSAPKKSAVKGLAKGMLDISGSFLSSFACSTKNGGNCPGMMTGDCSTVPAPKSNQQATLFGR